MNSINYLKNTSKSPIAKRRNTISSINNADLASFTQTKRRNSISKILYLPMLSIDLINETAIYIEIPKAPRSKDRNLL